MTISNLPGGIETIASSIYTAVEPLTKIGQIIRPIERPMGESTHWLRSGSEGYSCAVVIAVEPKLMMVSPMGDMLWCTDVKAENYEALGEADEGTMAIVNSRLPKE